MNRIRMINNKLSLHNRLTCLIVSFMIATCFAFNLHSDETRNLYAADRQDMLPGTCENDDGCQFASKLGYLLFCRAAESFCCVIDTPNAYGCPPGEVAWIDRGVCDPVSKTCIGAGSGPYGSIDISKWPSMKTTLCIS